MAVPVGGECGSVHWRQRAVMKSSNLFLTLLLLAFALVAVHWQLRKKLLMSGASSTLLERHVRLPTGNRCSVCRLSNVCLMEHHVTMSADSRSLIKQHAQKRSCRLRDEHGLRFLKRNIRFRRARAHYEGDLLDAEYLASKGMYKTKMLHIPHYMEYALQPAIRTATLIELANMTAARPLLITPAFKKRRQWFDGMHDAFAAAFGHVRVTTQQRHSCFQSVHVSKCDGVAPETVLFQQRVAAALHRHSNASAAGRQSDPVRVLILSRAATRRIAHVDAVERAVRSAFARHATRVRVQATQFEGKPFRYQLEQMARADVLVGAHGAGMANMLFMARGGSVLEVVPFAMGKAGFRRLSRLAGLQYERVVAAPDARSVERCAREKALRDAFWAQWRRALAGQTLSVGEDAAERDCVRRQDLHVREADLHGALERIASTHRRAR